MTAIDRPQDSKQHAEPRRSNTTVIVLGLVVVLQLAFFLISPKPKPVGDAVRFLAQADSLLDGQGYAYLGKPETTLPPGYPVFLFLILKVRHSIVLVRVTELLLAVIACWLVYFAMKPRGERFACVATLAMAAHPWLGLTATGILSEPLSVFLVSLIVFGISRMEGWPKQRVWAFIIGWATGGLALTAPAAIFLCIALVIGALWLSRRDVAAVGALFAGGVLLLIPWQVHCYRATGHIQPTLYTLNDSHFFEAGRALWIRSWSEREGDLPFLWGTRSLREAPPRIFKRG